MADVTDDWIVEIEELDQLRQQARALHQEAFQALIHTEYHPRPRAASKRKVFEEEYYSKDQDWRPPNDDVEKAMVLQALRKFKANKPDQESLRERSCENIRNDLRLIELEDCFKTEFAGSDESLDNVPIMRCAMVLQALIDDGQALENAALASAPAEAAHRATIRTGIAGRT